MKQLLLCAITTISLPLLSYAEDDKESTKPVAPTPEVKGDGASHVDSQAHEGVWRPIAAVLGGVRLPQSALKGIVLKVAGDKYEVSVAGEKEPDKGTYTLDTSARPRRMTIKSLEGPNKGKTFLAIYEMKDNESMRVCYDLSGTDFPKEFKARKDTQLYLVGYRRQKQ